MPRSHRHHRRPPRPRPIRDSKDATHTPLLFSASAWAAYVEGITR
ncbi:DUF397 domain-containing protein [Streptomyces sp. NPDC057257]